MAKPALFAKLKGFGPLIVIGTAVVVTIKLLTTTTPTVEEDLSVDAKEDISLTQYQDEIELPPPPPEEPDPKPEEKGEEKEKSDEEEDKEEETEEAGEEIEEEEPEAEEQATEEKQEEQQNKPKPLKWKEGHALTGVFSRLFNSGKKG